jgi:nucleoside-diphosphate-sugar epimerase
VPGEAPVPRVAVTGASGFIGRTLCRRLAAAGVGVRAIVRSTAAEPDAVAVGDLGPDTDWRAAIAGVDCVVHCAARAHVLDETATDPLAEYRRVNVRATEALARQAAAGGVRRLVYLSSIGVHGVTTNGRGPFRHDDAPAPAEPYAVSKLEAERALRAIAAREGIELVIVRPPLVYGPGVPANFLRLLRLVDRGWPLPFGAVRGRRSLLGVENLADLLLRCVQLPVAAGGTFLASDGEDLALPELIGLLAKFLGRRVPLLPVPPAMLRGAGRLAGVAAPLERLTGALEVDSTHTRDTLAWRPPVSVATGLAATARWYRAAVERP